MATPFIAQINIFPFNFAPQGFAFCNGQLLSISQNTALFSLVGTTYGGNGVSNFGLPNLQGCAVVDPGQGAGLSPYDLGQTGGDPTVTLLQSQIPPHTHTATGSSAAATSQTPAGVTFAEPPGNPRHPSNLYGTGTSAAMDASMVGFNSGGQSHNNMQPYLTLNFCIALVGIYPSRN